MFERTAYLTNRAHPVWLWLDPTTRCNLACRLCYTKQSHGKLDLDPNDLERALLKLRASPMVAVKTIHLNWRGEPLMNPKFAELLAVTRRILPDVPLQWHTNGTMLTAKRVREILAVPYSHKIFVSIDGGNSRSHDLNRGEGTFRKTLTGLRKLLDARGDDRSRVCVGVYQIDLNEPIEAYDPEFLELLERVDDHVKVTPLLPGGAHHKVRGIGDLESDEALHQRMSQDINPSLPVPRGTCFWAGHSFCLAPDGNVSVCVISHGREGVVGNLFDESVETVIGRGLGFRRRLELEGRGSVAHCASCRKPEGDVFSTHLVSRLSA
ncbi:radical SAM/SPASM domain-containing protein [Caulobacter sp. S45]|uniref:radical SAM protein n=1 Tax=Caulobacter sp. S45 TaxID=1641861 RepID=UPI00131B80CC|nr:radical SAM/SPASM domain-containing protein [Caulobacter sp. S45]